MNTQISRLDDPDMKLVPEVLKRAAERAKRLAEETGTPFIVRELNSSADDSPSTKASKQDTQNP